MGGGGYEGEGVGLMTGVVADVNFFVGLAEVTVGVLLLCDPRVIRCQTYI